VASRWRSQVAALVGAAVGLALTALAAAATTAAPAPQGVLGHLLAGLAKQPFVLLFLVVAAGYGLGRLQVKSVGLGATASTLIIALAVSLVAARRGVAISIPEFASTIFFNLFMFSVGMKVGPQFISGLRRGALPFIALAAIIPLLSVGLMLAVRAIHPLDAGFTPGIFAGANTATPGLGSAQAAYSATTRLNAAARADALGNLSTAFAFSYCISMVAFIVVMKVAPAIARRDVKKAAREFEASIKGAGGEPLPGAGDEFFGGVLPVDVRSYSLQNERAVGHRLAEIRELYPLVSIERVLRNGRVLEGRDEEILQAGDTLALYGRIPRLLAAGPRVGPEVDAPEMRDIGAETMDVVIHNPKVIGRKLIDLARDVGHGLYLNALFRGGEQIPAGPETVAERGDVIRVTGGRWRIATLEKELGRVVRPSIATDIVTLALGLAAGGLIGMITVKIGSVRLTIGSAVGLLLVGIALSILRTRNPAFGGPYPEPARRLLEDLGLNIFIAILGLNSGAGVIKAVGAGALAPILVDCLVVGFIPPVVAWLAGAYLFKMNDALLMGAVAGGRCNSAGMRAAQEATGSTVPAISYPVTFAISNILFTLLAYVMAMLG
jgi:putative transport protein